MFRLNERTLMRIALIDDEAEYRALLEKTVNSYLASRKIDAQIESFSDAESFLKVWEPLKYTIIFMDIYMPGMSGIEAAEKIREQDDSSILIFCTTSMDHMPDAFACHAFDYVVKPAIQDRVDKVMDDAMHVLPQLQRYFTFDWNGQKIRMLNADLVAVTTNGHYLTLDDRLGHSYSIRMTMSELLAEVGEDARFLEINRGIVVNMEHVTSMSGTRCVMANGKSLPIKVRNSTEIIQKWQDFCFNEIRANQSHMTERR